MFEYWQLQVVNEQLEKTANTKSNQTVTASYLHVNLIRTRTKTINSADHASVIAKKLSVLCKNIHALIMEAITAYLTLATQPNIAVL